jgi:hypothetical protein
VESNNDWLITQIEVIRKRLSNLEVRTLRKEVEIILFETVTQELQDPGTSNSGIEESLASAKMA